MMSPTPRPPRAGSVKRCLWAGIAAALLTACGAKPDVPDHPGRAVYFRYCFSCHQAGVAGAPKLGDGKAWTRRLDQGREPMLDNVKRGMPPGMPPRGGCPSCDDETLAAAVDFMIVAAQ